MNYFELFEIPESMKMDKGSLRRKFYQLSREYHPDHTAGASEAQQNEALRMTELINTAYKTLNDDQERIGYILRSQSLLSANENHQMPQDFLMQMMDINETVDDLQSEFDEQKYLELCSELDDLEKSLNIQFETNAEKFDIQDDRSGALENIKDYYLKSKYLLRIRENLSTFADS